LISSTEGRALKRTLNLSDCLNVNQQ
jgi:hypothetical protein